MQIDKSVLKKWATNESCVDCRLIVNCENKAACGYLFDLPHLSDQSIGGILLVLSLVVLCVSLMLMVKILNSLLRGSIADAIKRVVNPKFNNPLFGYLFGIFLIPVGAVGTVMVQSSSVFTSTLTPMVGMGYIELETCYPMFLGSNLGTTVTSMLAALTQAGSDTFRNTIQGSLVHLFFNIIGILLYYPIPFMRFPIPLAKALGKITASYRWFAVVYIIGMFFVLPGVFVGLTFIDSQGIAMYTFLAIVAILAILGGALNVAQSKEALRKRLPEELQTWEFLPKPLRSLEPYDRILTSLPCCRSCAADPDVESASPTPMTKDTKGIHNPTFTTFDERVY